MNVENFFMLRLFVARVALDFSVSSFSNNKDLPPFIYVIRRHIAIDFLQD